MKRSENELAKDYLIKVCEIKPKCTDAWTDYADFLFKTDELMAAAMAYGYVLNIDSELHIVRNNYGIVLLSLNRIDEAKEQLKIAHKGAACSAVILNNLADVYFMTGKFKKAISKYKEVIGINPSVMNAYFKLGICYGKFKAYKDALEIFFQGLIQEPKNVSILENVAVTFYLLNDMPRAVYMYKKCITVEPDNIEFYFEVSKIYYNNLKQYQKAAKYLKKCIKLDPDRIDLYNDLVAAYQKLHKYQKASHACILMGDLYLGINDRQNAKKSFERAVELCPSNALGHLKLHLI